LGDILAAFRSCAKVEGDFRIAFLRIVATGSQWVGLHAGAIVPVQLPTKFELVINLKTAVGLPALLGNFHFASA